jgi:hypothetical protein
MLAAAVAQGADADTDSELDIDPLSLTSVFTSDTYSEADWIAAEARPGDAAHAPPDVTGGSAATEPQMRVVSVAADALLCFYQMHAGVVGGGTAVVRVDAAVSAYLMQLGKLLVAGHSRARSERAAWCMLRSLAAPLICALRCVAAWQAAL